MIPETELNRRLRIDFNDRRRLLVALHFSIFNYYFSRRANLISERCIIHAILWKIYIKPNFSFLFIIKPNIISERCIIFRSKRCVRSLSLSPIQYFCVGEANTEQSHEEVVPMASILSQPSYCIRIHRRCCFNTLRFFSSKPFASHSNSHHHFSHRPIRKTFALDVSRSFSQSHHLLNTDAPTLHHFIAQASLIASQPPPE